jgi:PAS domain S-box-containing protein
MFGVTASEATSGSLDRFLPDRVRSVHREHLRRFAETGETSRAMGRLGVLTARRADGGEFPIEATISQVEADGQKLLTVVMRDVSDRQRIEREREALLHQAEHAARAREELLAIVAHDLRTPLTVIEMCAAAAMRSSRGDGDVRFRTNSEKILNAASRMERMISDLLDASAIDHGTLGVQATPCAVRPIVEEAAGAFVERAAQKGVSITSDVPAGLAARCDAGRIAQLLGNLIRNGVEHTPPGGAIEVRARLADGGVVVTVRDTGPGIAPEHLPHLFDRFWRPPDRPRAAGAGLGLYIASGVAKLHGGQLTVESREGEGAAFSFMLPADVRPDA